jgi:hypothetical protein
LDSEALAAQQVRVQSQDRREPRRSLARLPWLRQVAGLVVLVLVEVQVAWGRLGTSLRLVVVVVAGPTWRTQLGPVPVLGVHRFSVVGVRREARTEPVSTGALLVVELRVLAGCPLVRMLEVQARPAS